MDSRVCIEKMTPCSSPGIFVGERNTGKTTMLLRLVERALANRNTVFVFDSATNHCEKSLLKKCEKYFPYFQQFSLSHFSSWELFNLEAVIRSRSVDFFLFDVSAHLENSHMIENPLKKTIERSLYKREVNAILKTLLHHFSAFKKKVIIFDEIEITNGIARQLNVCIANSVPFWGALHPDRISNVARKNFNLFFPPFTQYNTELKEEVQYVQ